MPEKNRSKGSMVVDIAVPIGVPKVRPIPSDEDNRRIGGSIDGNDSTGNEAAIRFQNLGGFRIRTHVPTPFAAAP